MKYGRKNRYRKSGYFVILGVYSIIKSKKRKVLRYYEQQRFKLRVGTKNCTYTSNVTLKQLSHMNVSNNYLIYCKHKWYFMLLWYLKSQN